MRTASQVHDAALRLRQPLRGRRVVVTRPRAQAASLVARLEAYGAEVVSLPTIRLEPPDDWGPLDAAVRRLDQFTWVVFTSINGVAAFRERLRLAGLDARALAGRRVAAIGPGTAETLARAGVRLEVVPGEYRAEGLVETLGPRVGPGTEVLLVRAAEARELLPRELAARGARVTVAPAYRTVTETEGGDRFVALLEAHRVDVVTFTSSSTVRGLVALLAPDSIHRLLDGVVLAAIGPITAATLAEYGLSAQVAPREYTVGALASAIAAHFDRPSEEAV
jgi:uroporphyrinogen III methyltransferase/synthase